MASAIQLRMGTGHTTKYYNINPTTIQHSHSFFQIFFVSTPGSNLSPEQTSQSKPHPTVQKWGQPSYQRSQKFHLPFLCETKSLCVTRQLNYQNTVSLSYAPPLGPCNLCRCCVLFLSQSVTILDQLVAALPLQDQENAGIQACTMYLLNWWQHRGSAGSLVKHPLHRGQHWDNHYNVWIWQSDLSPSFQCYAACTY